MKFWCKLKKHVRGIVIAIVLLVLLVVSVIALYRNTYTCKVQYEMKADEFNLDRNFVYMYDVDNTIMMRACSDKLCLLLQGHKGDTFTVSTSYTACGNIRVWFDIVVTTDWGEEPMKIGSSAVKFTTLSNKVNRSYGE